MLPMKIVIKSVSLCTLKLFALFNKLYVEEQGWKGTEGEGNGVLKLFSMQIDFSI